jgi:hypothetical protein
VIHRFEFISPMFFIKDSPGSSKRVSKVVVDVLTGLEKAQEDKEGLLPYEFHPQ